jgi:hypothetical protein
MKIHSLGLPIPFNPDNFPERGSLTGAGTERPIGFPNLDLIARFYWTVRSFQFGFGAIPAFDYTFESFLAGGGSTGTIIGSTAGLANTAAPIPIDFSGRTKILHIFNKKVRRSREGVYKNLTQEEFFKKENNDPKLNALDIDPNIKPNAIGTTSNRPTEGWFVSPGGYHTAFNNFGSLFINFSDVIYQNRQYWPKIIILMQNPAGGAAFRSAIVTEDPLYSRFLNNLPGINTSLKLGGRFNIPTIGGLVFLGGFIPLFGQDFGNVYGMAQTYIIIGGGTIGSRCCDRYYFDGVEDEDRDCYNEAICNDGPQGVYREEILDTDS